MEPGFEHSAEFRRCLIECDIEAARKLWAHTAPHLYQPKDDAEALVMLHRARTEAHSVPLRLRTYSHSWLIERGLPSGLHDDLKPKAERVYPRIAGVVGISVKAGSPERVPLARAIHGAMSDAVMGLYASGQHDPKLVKAAMMRARNKVLRSA